jgi:hypothetical protein
MEIMRSMRPASPSRRSSRAAPRLETLPAIRGSAFLLSLLGWLFVAGNGIQQSRPIESSTNEKRKPETYVIQGDSFPIVSLTRHLNTRSLSTFG